mmetsp:Transcript_32188/g.54050  ORF Transcript_32188/g.54050 Transcript_32188/m.54050 type:complete len:227 (+) Transcript_32188:680-1360(+)
MSTSDSTTEAPTLMKSRRIWNFSPEVAWLSVDPDLEVSVRTQYGKLFLRQKAPVSSSRATISTFDTFAILTPSKYRLSMWKMFLLLTATSTSRSMCTLVSTSHSPSKPALWHTERGGNSSERGICQFIARGGGPWRGCTSQPCCITNAFPTAISLLAMISFMEVVCGDCWPYEGSANLFLSRPSRPLIFVPTPPLSFALIAASGSSSEAMLIATAPWVSWVCEKAL